MTTKDELISFSLSFLHNPASSSSALLAAVLFRLSDFCQWCSDFEQRLITRLDPQLFNQLVASFEKRETSIGMCCTMSAETRPSPTHLWQVEKIHIPQVHYRVLPLCIRHAAGTVSSQRDSKHALFFSVCRTADRLMDIIANFKLVYTSH